MKFRAWLSVLLCLPMFAHGWGAGHDAVARAVAARVPEPWHSRLQGATLQQFCADSHYPDSFEPFPVERVGEAELTWLRSMGIAKRYDLHSDKGRAVAFCMLVRALDSNQPDRALTWLAALSHSTADMAACNHDPVVHMATYGWCSKEWSMKLPGGKPFSEIIGCLDLGWVKDEIFGRYVDEALLRDNGCDAAAALLEIMLYGVQGVEACAPRGAKVLSAAAELAETGAKEAAARLGSELSALGAWAAARVLRDFHVALRLAAAKQMPALTPDLLARYETQMDAFVQTRALTSDLFAQSAMEPSNGKGAAIGVVIEPCWRMNEGMFGFGDRVLAVQIVSSLRSRGQNAELVDVRQLLGKGMPAREMPVLIVPAQRCVSYRTLKVEMLDGRLSEFLDAGGEVLWVGGGKPPAALCRGQPKDFMVKGGDKDWPERLEAFSSWTLAVGLDQGAMFPCQRPPGGTSGWQWPTNPYSFGGNGALAFVGKPLLQWRGKRMASKSVGMAWPKEKASVAYVPGYSVVPYVWTKETPSLCPLRLELDAAGINVVESALRALE